METFTINYAKTHLSRQIEKAAKAEAFIIAKAGKPLVNVVPFDAPARGAANRIGFMKGRSDLRGGSLPPGSKRSH